jgi:8-oxo-dGTP pyrophosphatase MutT (NUDIX family)
MKFNNVPNEELKLPDGRTVWLSRAVAVVGTLCLIKDNIPYFLISKRGEGASDFQGLFNNVCGYLDYSETTGEAFIRETWEECGINVSDILEKGDIKISHIETPWDVNTDPNENRQNVCIHHGLIAIVDELPIPEIRNEVEDNEVSEILWVPISDIDKYEYAFNHLERLNKFIRTFNEYL